jgi:sialic acid synthase SpsE
MTFIVAEAGLNYEGDVNIARVLVQSAARAGANAIKFQTFNPDLLSTKWAAKFWDIDGPGNTQYEEFISCAQMTLEDYREIKAIADEAGIDVFSTPCDIPSVDLLEKIPVPGYKIASMDITYVQLLAHVASKGKPIILSTGASTLAEVRTAVAILKSGGAPMVSLLQCTSTYPTRLVDVNLRMMQCLMHEFPDLVVGYSDHTTMPFSLHVCVAAATLRAGIIEKHFTFNKSRSGYDHQISADVNDLKRIVQAVRCVDTILGSWKKQPVESEETGQLLGRRSVVTLTEIPAGTHITKDMVGVKRPGTGIPPVFLDKVIGTVVNKTIPADRVITWEMISV